MCKALAILTTAMEGSSIVFILQMKIKEDLLFVNN